MNNKKVKGIVKFNIQKGIQNKWFIIFNIITLIVTVFSLNIDNIKEFLSERNINIFEEYMVIEILDKEKLATEQIKEAFKADNFEVKEVNEIIYNKNTIPDDLVVVEINKSEEDIVAAKVISKDAIDGYIYDEIDEVLKKVRSDLFAEKNKIGKEELEKLNEPINMEKVLMSVDAENSETKEMIKMISTFAIYGISIFIFSKISNDIAQEKVSKSIEYVLTSVSEKEYLLAKIISVIGITLLQGLYFIIYYFIGNLINNLINIADFQSLAINTAVIIEEIDKDIVLYVITVIGYGVLTLILMSIIQAALSSKTTNMEEAGNTTALLTTITIIAYIVTLFLITPYTKMNAFLYILSCIPLLSNYFIPAIMIIGQATPLQIIVSLVLLIISIPVAFNKCAVIFKNGVLDYKTVKINKKQKVKKQISFEEEQKLDLIKKKYKNIGFILGMAIIIYFSTSVIFDLISTVLISPMLLGMLNIEQINLISLCLNSLASLSLSAIFVLAYTEKQKQDVKVEIKEKIKFVIEGIFLLGIIQIGLSYLYELIGIDYNIISTIAVENNKNVLTNILLVTCLAIIPGIFEELLFRKALINATSKIGIGFSIIVSSLIFGLIHMNLGQCIFAFLIGLIFAYIYVKTQDIKITMLLHFLNNGYAAIQMLVTSKWVYDIINAVIIGIMIVGCISLIIRILKSYKNKEVKFKFNKEEMKNYKYIFIEYTFIVALVLVGLMFVCTENILRIG